MIPAHHISRIYSAQKPLWMGIVNVTPDSFSDGGKHLDLTRALIRCHELVGAGAHILDIGGESTRPGSTPVGTAEELSRVLPVAEAVRREFGTRILISIDSYRSEVIEILAQRNCVDIVNDIYAGQYSAAQQSTIAVASQYGLGMILMHMQGTPATMQLAPLYQSCVAEVAHFLKERAQAALNAGVQFVAIDPGIGFGKSFAHNKSLLAPNAIQTLQALGFPVLIGLSRKKFFTELYPDLNLKNPESRDPYCKILESECILAGATLIRTHIMPSELNSSENKT